MNQTKNHSAKAQEWRLVMSSNRSSPCACLLVLLALGVFNPGVALAGGTPYGVVAEMTAGDVIRWKPKVEFERLVLTVVGPFDDFRKEFEAGERLVFDLRDDRGEALRDGSYSYELRVVPKLSAEVKKLLSDSGATDERARVRRDLRRSGKLPRSAHTQSGTFMILKGKLVDPRVEEKEPQANGDR